MLIAKELRQKYLEFFKEKGHAIIPSASVVPENDPTVLFTTAGMHPLVPYLMGEKHPLGTRLANVQKCIRTGDIDEVGDTTHHTFFEMLGNWSLGDYFKKEALEWSWEFLTSEKWLGLDRRRLACSVFKGDKDAAFDEEAFDIWKKLGMPESKIAKLPKENNWWGPAGITGPCGPDSEMFYWVGDAEEAPNSFNDDNSKWVEIWNDVFMEFNKNIGGKYEKLSAQNVDTGMGMERVLAVMNNYDDNYKTEIFWPIIEKIEELSNKSYSGEENKKPMRIIADHIKAAVFIIADGVTPSNVERGYVLRRLVRRAIRQGHIVGINENFTTKIAKIVQEIYEEVYPEIMVESVFNVLEEEENKFRKTLERGIKELARQRISFNQEKKHLFIHSNEQSKDFEGNKLLSPTLGGDWIFNFYQERGFPFEMVIEEIEKKIGAVINIEQKEHLKSEFSAALKKPQELSRTASAGMFKGGLADTKEKTTALHTAAHLMLAGLRKVLGEHVHQKGSNINGERIRFDFSHPDKMTDEQKKAVEDFVNEAIQAAVSVTMEEMTLDEAKDTGAEGAFEHKYGEKVKVYTAGEYSKEICGGPHVENTSEIKGVFRIVKEESSGAGVRRIKAVVE